MDFSVQLPETKPLDAGRTQGSVSSLCSQRQTSCGFVEGIVYNMEYKSR